MHFNLRLLVIYYILLIFIIVIFIYFQRRGKCPICFDNYKILDILSPTQKMWTLPCGHRFHTKCIIKWFQYDRRCCLCRSET